MSSRWLSKPDPSGLHDVEKRLRVDVPPATIEPSAGLRRRTISALARTAPVEPGAIRRLRSFSLLPAYAASCAVLMLIATAAVTQTPAPSVAPKGAASRIVAHAPGANTPGDRTVVIGIDTTRLDETVKARARQLGASMESPLMKEAKSIIDDAFNAAGLFLASLPGEAVRIERIGGTRGGATRPERQAGSEDAELN